MNSDFLNYSSFGNLSTNQPPMEGKARWSIPAVAELSCPFSVYAMLLVSLNSCITLIRHPISIFRDLYGDSSLGYLICTLYLYSRKVLSECVVYTHVLITTNQIWAIGYPISYRNFYTKNLASGICVCKILCIHTISLPLVIMDALYYRQGSNPCELNAQAQAKLIDAVAVIVFILPITITAAAYPFL